MGALAIFIDKIASVIDSFVALLPGFSVDNGLLSSSIDTLLPYFNIANVIFPVKETLVVLGILCTFSLVMFTFWGIQRAINLLRGSG